MFENLKSTGIAYVLTKLKDYFLQIKDAVKSVNGELPDETGDITINSVPYAQNLESDTSHRNAGTFIQRTSGGDSSVVNGDAWLMVVRGNNEHNGYTDENIEWNMTVIGDDDHITASFNRDTFVNYVENSGTVTLAFSTEWSADPSLYGFTITGTPVAGDTITIVYVKEVRGTITVANPQTFVSTGWNLFDLSNGYAKVVSYEFGYRIEGPYSTIKFASTPSGTQSSITVSSGNFDIPSDGYVIVTGGTSETAIYATWEDWTEGHSGTFEAYNASTIDLTNVMSEYFPYGLLKAGTTVDEIDLNLGQAISRVERLAYNSTNLATAKGSGREYEYDENYIYLARASAVSSAVTIDGSYIVDDHGIEYFTTTALEVPVEVLYGNNLKNKLERDVLTFSNDLVDNLTTNNGSKALSAKQGKILNDRMANMPSFMSRTVTAPGTTLTVASSSRVIIDTLSTAAGRCGTLFAYVNASGGVTCFKNGASDITLNVSVANKLTLSCSSSFTAYIRVYAGSVS